MKILLGFMGTNKSKEKYQYAKETSDTRFPIVAIYEKNKADINIVICMGTDQSINNRKEVSININKVDNNLEDEILNQLDTYDRNSVEYENALDHLYNKYKSDKCILANFEDITRQEEFNNTFIQIDNILQKYAKEEEVHLIIDMTNGYRTQPLLLLLVANFVSKKNNNIFVDNVWYGIQPTSYQNSASLISLNNHNQLLDWAEGLQNYLDNGDTNLLYRIISQSENQDSIEYNLVYQLDLFSKRLKVCRIDEAFEKLQDVKDAINDFKIIGNSAKFGLLSLILDQIILKLEEFDYGFWFATILWNYRHGNIQQAITTISEFFPMFLFEYDILLSDCFNVLTEGKKIKKFDKQITDQYLFQSILLSEKRKMTKGFAIRDDITDIKSYLYNSIRVFIENMTKTELNIACTNIMNIFTDNTQEYQDYQKFIQELKPILLESKCNEAKRIIEHYDEYMNNFLCDVINKYIYSKNGGLLVKLTNDRAMAIGMVESITPRVIWSYDKKSPLKDIRAEKFIQYYTSYDYKHIYLPLKKKINSYLYYENDKTKKVHDFFSEENIKKSYKYSTYYLNHQELVDDVIESYKVIKEYRNDINHSGSSIAKKLTKKSGATKSVEDYYDEDKLGIHINKIIDFMKNIEKEFK